MGPKPSSTDRRRYRRRNFRDLEIIGRTATGQRVVRGIFPLVNSEGIALDVLVHGLWIRGCVPDWLDFMRAAQAFGWNLKTTCSRVLQAVSDVHGRPWRDAVEHRLDPWMASQTSSFEAPETKEEP